MIRSVLVLCLLFGSTSTALGQQFTGKNGAADQALPEIKIDRDNIVVRESARIKPGRYVVADNDGNGVLQIAADNVVLDFSKAILESRRNAKDGAKDQFDGTGIAISGRKNVTVRNANVHGYRFNLRATDSRELTIEKCDLSHSRAQRISRNGQPIDIFLDIRHPDEWREYGAAIWLENCRKSRVQGSRAQGAQNGLCLVSTNGTTAYDNDFSFNSGWGIALSGSKNNVVSWNHCDFVNRPCQNGGGDNAGLAVVNGSDRNYFVGNSLLYGGDGFFLTDGENGGVRPSNHNVVALNDGSWADAIAFEGTFSTGNIYYKNVASDCNYGFWLGWASGNLIVDNVIERNRICGIDIGCGQHHRIEGNQIRASGQSAIHLYNDEEDPTVVAKGFTLVNNTLETAPLGLQIVTQSAIQTSNPWRNSVGKRLAESLSTAYTETLFIIQEESGSFLGSAQGAPFYTAKLAASPVNAQRREIPLSAFSRFLAFLQGFAACLVTGALVFQRAERGAVATYRVGTEPRILGPKLSESLINSGPTKSLGNCQLRSAAGWEVDLQAGIVRPSAEQDSTGLENQGRIVEKDAKFTAFVQKLLVGR